VTTVSTRVIGVTIDVVMLLNTVCAAIGVPVSRPRNQ
jgi:hypothetical protein